ncbi:helix-turn-helix domain-containing protein [Burkholderia gladioli]|uniref:helix-turn-helix domain-containing protein n=1 Tax=Burkholderia gladioli TaxID=28095 RepID=UPI00163E26D2|nr:helix-turn-helix domain-containing protein [Burkholderia gladioli]MDA0569671.1 helix-turn-helix domain-containing protein [Burkholderia gladioli]MDA0597837.1 helix-turn-helix domain-containing protein [Burkholderia gladioli]
MSTTSEGLSYRFSTAYAPARERFDAWRADTGALFDIGLLEDEHVPYDSQFDFTLLDQIMFGGRQWLHPEYRVEHAMSRSAQRIRSDGLDGYYLQLQISETLSGSAGRDPVLIGPGDMCVLDLATPFDLKVSTGDTICMVIPRDLLPAGAAALHGRSLSHGMGSMLADYLRSLRRNMSVVSAGEMPYAVQATKNMLLACLAPTLDTLKQAETELDAMFVNRVRDYIEQHLLSPDLSPDRICKAMGISRSKLYRLFEPTGGVARLIQHKRLHRARNLLIDPTAKRMRISEVAWRHGFVNEKHFSRLFKEKFGCTPSEVAAREFRRESEYAHASPEQSAASTNFSDWMRSFVSL